MNPVIKLFITTCAVALLNTNLDAQEKKLSDFKKEINAYIDFTSGKKVLTGPIDSK